MQGAQEKLCWWILFRLNFKFNVIDHNVSFLIYCNPRSSRKTLWDMLILMNKNTFGNFPLLGGDAQASSRRWALWFRQTLDRLGFVLPFLPKSLHMPFATTCCIINVYRHTRLIFSSFDWKLHIHSMVLELMTSCSIPLLQKEEVPFELELIGDFGNMHISSLLHKLTTEVTCQTHVRDKL